tara:strand:+ start:863 stop:1273 length:411 start_codon:yes stop_codon:yes gene_type:complete
MFIFKKDTWMLILACSLFMLLTEPVRSQETWEVIRSEKIYVNVEKKIETGRTYTCKDVPDHSDQVGKAIVLALAGSMIDSEHAILGAFTGLLTGNVNVKKVCYDSISYDKVIVKEYSHTLITLSNGKIEVQKRIQE